MIRILILASIGAVVSATPFFADHPLGLESLFARKREAIGENKEKESTVCETEACKLIADKIKEGIDDSVDPCDDFYQYACGKWDQKNPVPENKTSWSLWEMVDNKINKQIKGIIESPIESNDLFAVKMAKKWYQTCKNEEKNKTDEITPIIATLWRYGGWPLIMEEGEWDDRIYNWQKVDDHFARLTGMSTFYDLFFAPLQNDGNKTLILDTPHLPAGMYKLLSEPYQGSDASDENNESGEGSQENGSKEKIPKTDEDDEDDEEDEGIEEDNEPEDEDEEESQARRVSGRRSHKRLGHNKRSSRKHSVGRKHHETHLGRRPKRNVIHEIVFHKIRSLKKRAKHGVHQKSRKAGRKSSGHKHLPSVVQKKSSTGKNGMKRSEKINNANVKSANKKKHAVHKKRVTNDEENEEVRRKNRSHHHGHGRRSIHGSHQHKQRRLGDHRVHHADRKMEDKETDEAPNDNDNENEDNSSGNEVDTGSNENDDNTNDEENGNDDDNEDEEGNDDGEGDEEKKEDDEEEDEKTVEELTEMYRKYIVSVAESFAKVRGVEISRDKLEKDADDLIKFAIKVGEITLDGYALENMTLSEFQEWYDSLGHTKNNSKVNWERKVLKLFAEAGLDLEGDVNVTLTRIEYFEKLHGILEETPANVIVNYIHWRFISTVGHFSSSVIQELAEDWDPMSESDKENMCMNVEMSDIIGYEYTKKHFPAKLERMTRDMIDDIQKEVEYQIKESTWLDDSTKHFILDKLVHLQHLIGSPEWYQNATMVQRYFQGLTIGTSYYENIVNYVRYLKWKQFRTVFIPDEYAPLSMDPLVVNAFFIPTENVIAIPAADLQNPFFDTNRPWSANFGIIGSIIAHEVNHGFDDTGHLYDRTGKPTEWLSAMASAYDKRAECFVRQFNNYEIVKGDSFKVKNYGNQTEGENIADTMGLEAVFRAYHRRLRACKNPDPALPGLEQYNNNQTFFLSFARLWCEAQDPESLKSSAKDDEHSPGRLRVIGSVSNMDGFAKSFNCPAGSPMNPEKKCNIWL